MPVHRHDVHCHTLSIRAILYTAIRGSLTMVSACVRSCLFPRLDELMRACAACRWRFREVHWPCSMQCTESCCSATMCPQGQHVWTYTRDNNRPTSRAFVMSAKSEYSRLRILLGWCDDTRTGGWRFQEPMGLVATRSSVPRGHGRPLMSPSVKTGLA